jgi:hypothetical protein
MISCDEEVRLAGLYKDAIAVFGAMQGRVRDLSRSGRFASAIQNANYAAKVAMLHARYDYWSHLESHHCRDQKSSRRKRIG